jgi:hypothetical protein
MLCVAILYIKDSLNSPVVGRCPNCVHAVAGQTGVVLLAAPTGFSCQCSLSNQDRNEFCNKMARVTWQLRTCICGKRRISVCEIL